MKYIIIVILIAVVWSMVGYFTSRVEQAEYTVLSKTNSYEIRKYPEHIIAQTTVEGDYRSGMSSGFRIVAGYIFGGNTSKQPIAMTAPVHMDFSGASSSMSFVMPEKYDMASLPKPKDATVEIKQSEPVYAAVIAFGGYANDEKINDYTNKLVALLQKKNIKIIIILEEQKRVF